MEHIKKRIYKFFNVVDTRELKALEDILDEKVVENDILKKELVKKDIALNKPVTQEQVMKYCLDTFGIPYIDFSRVDQNGYPPHYLDGLTEVERKIWIGHIENLYNDSKLQAIFTYVINLIGNHSVQKADDDKMRNGKIGIIAIRTLMSELLQGHEEFVDSRKPSEEFDPLAIMPD